MQPTLWFVKLHRAKNESDYESWREGGVVNTLNAFDIGDKRTTVMINTETVVRRLTPVECERLQGFPDNWTEGQADIHRYKQMGNAVAVPVVEWIMSRLVEADGS